MTSGRPRLRHGPAARATTTSRSTPSSPTSSGPSTGFLPEHPDEPKRIFCTYTAMMTPAPAASPRATGWPSFGEEHRMTSKGPDQPRPPLPARDEHLRRPRQHPVPGRRGSAGTATSAVVHNHHPGGDAAPQTPHLLVGGGGQDSRAGRVEDDLGPSATGSADLAADGTPMLMICGMYQLFGNAFITVEGQAPARPRHPRRHHAGQRQADDRPGRARHGLRRRRRLREPLRVDGPRRGPAPFGHGALRPTATTAPTAPRAPSSATSSAPTSTARSCRRTRSSPTR